MDFKLVDKETKAELFFDAQGADDHTQLDVHICVLDGDKQHDFSFDYDELYFVGMMINRKTGFDIFNLDQIEKMDDAQKEAWEKHKDLNK